MQYGDMTQNEIINALKQKLDRPIVLVGMMGSGKSHIGRQLASELGLKFIDTDSVIVERAGASVAEIFERDGEAKFREAEKNTILELLDQPPCVIATGGGLPVNSESLQAIREKSYSVWLEADIETLLERTAKNKNRPLLQQEDPSAVLQDLLEKRRDIYAQADIRVDSSAGEAREPVSQIIKLLCESLNPDSVAVL